VSYCPPSAVPAASQRLRAPGLAWWKRAIAVAGGVVLLTLLVTAALLRPSKSGMGTHRQLGLPPCSLVMVAGIRCPSCGMTTSWAHLMRGNVVGSVRANAGGTLFALAALVSGPWLLVSGVKGRWVMWTPDDRLLLGIGLTMIGVTLIDWFVRLKFDL
jgi:hypothetical protein